MPSKKKSVATDQKTLKMLKALGYRGDIVSRHVGRVAMDFCGFADLIAWDGTGIFAIQSTTSNHFANRARKILENQDARNWIIGPGRILLVAWRPDGTLREYEITANDFASFDLTGQIPRQKKSEQIDVQTTRAD